MCINSRDSLENLSHAATSPATVRNLALNHAPDFIAAGDFDADGTGMWCEDW